MAVAAVALDANVLCLLLTADCPLSCSLLMWWIPDSRSGWIFAGLVLTGMHAPRMYNLPGCALASLFGDAV